MRFYFLKCISVSIAFFSLIASAQDKRECIVTQGVKSLCTTGKATVGAKQEYFYMISQVDSTLNRGADLIVKYRIINVTDNNSEIWSKKFTGNKNRNYTHILPESESKVLKASVEIISGNTGSLALIYFQNLPCKNDNKHYECANPLTGM